jgi:hypothetical protein
MISAPSQKDKRPGHPPKQPLTRTKAKSLPMMFINMSELQIILLAGLLRALLVAALITRMDLRNRKVLMVLALSLLFSTLFLLICLMLFWPAMILVTGFLIDSQVLFQVAISLLVAGVFVIPLVIELKSNLAALSGAYQPQRIKRSTLWGHAFSTVVILLWLWVNVQG